MLIKVEDEILPVRYDDRDRSCDEMRELECLASEYEGNMKGRVGFNFPITKKMKLPKWLQSYTNTKENTKNKEIKYLIAYKNGDVATLKHELQHAKYYLDTAFREKVKEIWESLSESVQSTVKGMLTRMGYPEHVMMDEFQAYLFTEKPNFFGKRIF